MTKKKVLFICAENACRSQMAEALYNAMGRGSSAESAGTMPALRVNAMAIEVLIEIGIDISGNSPKQFDINSLDDYERIISFGCIAKAAFPKPQKLEEWLIEDPAGKDLDDFRITRDEIRQHVRHLVHEIEG